VKRLKDISMKKSVNIVVAVRCLNEEKNIERFLHGYDFADSIVVSDGGSTDDSLNLLSKNKKVIIHNYDVVEKFPTGCSWNPDNPHINFVLEKAKKLSPDWLILDDMDDVPTYTLRRNARKVLEHTSKSQVNAFRLYMWGDREFFPYMNRDFDKDYLALWAWRPDELDIYADEQKHHATYRGISSDYEELKVPMALLHKSWHPDTIDDKVKWYNSVGIKTSHPFNFAGKPKRLPPWAKE
jgi:glycosyltransferase involved in cell wall biosynthesis